MIQLRSTLRANAVPQAPQFRPPTVDSASQPTVSGGKSSNTGFDQYRNIASQGGEGESRSEMKPANHEEQKMNADVSPAVKLVGAQEKTPANTAVRDHLGDARSKVQEDITRNLLQSWQLGYCVRVRLLLWQLTEMQRYGDTPGYYELMTVKFVRRNS